MKAGGTLPAAREPERVVRVLLVIEDRALANTIDLTLRHGGYSRRAESTVQDAKAAMTEWKPHLLLLDIDVESGGGVQLIEEARAGGPIGVTAPSLPRDLLSNVDA